MVRAASLDIGIGVRTEGLQRGFRRTRRETASFGDRLAADMRRYSARAAVGLGALTTALAAVSVQAGRTFSQISQDAASVNLPVGEYSQLVQAFRELGVEGEDTRALLNDLQDRLGDAASGTRTYIEAFDGIGVSWERLRTLSPTEALVETVGALSDLENATDRSFRANEIFGGNAERIGRLYGLNAQELRGLVAAQTAYNESAVAGFQGVERAAQSAANSFTASFGNALGQSQGVNDLAGAVERLVPHISDFATALGELTGILASATAQALDGARENAGFVSGTFGAGTPRRGRATAPILGFDSDSDIPTVVAGLTTAVDGLTQAVEAQPEQRGQFEIEIPESNLGEIDFRISQALDAASQLIEAEQEAAQISRQRLDDEAKAASEAAERISALTGEFERIEESVNPLLAAQRRYQEAVAVANQALAEGIVGQERYAEAVQGAAERLSGVTVGLAEVAAESSQSALEGAFSGFGDDVVDGINAVLLDAAGDGNPFSAAGRALVAEFVDSVLKASNIGGLIDRGIEGLISGGSRLLGFADGGVVPRTGPIFAHQDEIILNVAQQRNVAEALSERGQGSGVTQYFQFANADAASTRQLVRMAPVIENAFARSLPRRAAF